MSAITSVGVVGAGTAGCLVAGLLARGGISVDLYEQRTSLDTGSGIALQANALRVLRDVGVLTTVLDLGYGFNTTAIRIPGPSARVVAELTEGRFDPDLPATVGIARSDLARILLDYAREGGVRIHHGTTVEATDQSADKVSLTLEHHGHRRTDVADLVIGADGLHSTVRTAIGIHIRPEPLPLILRRVFIPRPTTITRMEIVNGGPARLAGLCPAGPDHAYAWLTEDVEEAEAQQTLTSTEQLADFTKTARAYYGPWRDVVAAIGPTTPINTTRYTHLLLAPPWHRGRVVLIGDAVHSCPPTMAQGAAMSIEDAAVLAQMLLTAQQVDDSLLTAFAARRLPRVRAVVDGSMLIMNQQLGHGAHHLSVPDLMSETSRLLSATP